MQKVDLTVSGSVEQDTITVQGRHNLPDGALLSWVVEHQDSHGIQGGEICRNRQYWFRILTRGSGEYPDWAPGTVKVTVTFDPGDTRQPSEVRKRYGDKGQYIGGDHVVKLESTRVARVTTTLLIPASSQTRAASSVTVYITDTGERYHRSGCRYLRKSRIAISLEEAKAGGFTPCLVCKPPN